MKLPVWVSQSVAGTEGTTFYAASYAQTLGPLDEFPAMRKVIGDENYRSYMSAARTPSPAHRRISCGFFPNSAASRKRLSPKRPISRCQAPARRGQAQAETGRRGSEIPIEPSGAV